MKSLLPAGKTFDHVEARNASVNALRAAIIDVLGNEDEIILNVAFPQQIVTAVEAKAEARASGQRTGSAPPSIPH